MEHKNILLLLFLSFICFSATAQKNFKVTISVPSSFNTKEMTFFYNTGKETVMIKPDFKNNQTRFTGKYYSKYATILINYPKDNHDDGFFYYNKTFWIGEKEAKINFNEKSNNASTKNPLENPELVNAFEVSKMGGDELESFIAKEQKDFDSINHIFNTTVIPKEDSLSRKLFAEKLRKLDDKKLEFITSHPERYFSFWYYKNQLLGIGAGLGNFYKGVTPDSLLKIYNATFPDSVKNSVEGEEIVKRLKGRCLKKGKQAPVFTTTDINGKTVSLTDFRNKHVLLVFWASWCGPCMKEAPTIKQIRDHYLKDKLEIIAFTLDRDTAKFNEAIKKFDMNYVHIFRNEDMLNTFGIIGIPEIFLIDGNGVVQYKSNDDEPDLTNKELPYLKDLLEQRLKNL